MVRSLRLAWLLAFLICLSMRMNAQGNPPDTNVVVVILDDVGIEWIPAYGAITGVWMPGGVLWPKCPLKGVSSYAPSTPNLDAIVGHASAKACLFQHAWSNPTCSPTRIVLNTGQFACFNGVGVQILEANPTSIRPKTTLAWGVKGMGKQAHMVGKYHMQGANGLPALNTIAAQAVGPVSGGGYGFDTFYRNYFNPWEQNASLYCAWKKWDATPTNIPSTHTNETKYMLCDLSDKIKTLIAAQTTDFYLWYALPTPWDQPHRPPNFLPPAAPESCNSPPLTLHGTTFTVTMPSQAAVMGEVLLGYKALIESADTMIGELVKALDLSAKAVDPTKSWWDYTTLVIVGDNGSPQKADTECGITTNFYWPSGQAKETVWEGGIRVPLIIAGRGVTVDGVCTTPVMAADLYPTINALIGAQADPAVQVNGVSLVPLLTGQSFQRTGTYVYGPYLYAETFSQNFDPSAMASPWFLPPGTTYVRAGTDGTYKVIKEYQKITTISPDQC